MPPTTTPSFAVGSFYWVETQYGLCRVECAAVSPRRKVVSLKAIECDNPAYCCGDIKPFEVSKVRIVEAL